MVGDNDAKDLLNADDDDTEDENTSDESSDDDQDNDDEFDAEAFAEDTRADNAARDAAIQELTRAVGRAQSTVDTQAKAGDSSRLVDDLQQQNGEIMDVLATALGELGEDTLSASLLQRVATLQESHRKTEAGKALREEVATALKAATDAQQPTTDTTQVSTIEAAIVAEIKDFGLNPDDTDLFDWKKAAGLLQMKGEAAMRSYFRAQVRAGLAADGADTRRQARKQGAGKSARGAGATSTPQQKIADTNASQEDKLKALRKMGVRV